VEVAKVKGRAMYRVLAGPAESRGEAEAMLDTLRKAGGMQRLLVRTLLTPGF